MNELLISKEKELKEIENTNNNENNKSIKNDINNDNDQSMQIPILRKKIDELEKINSSFQEENLQLKEEQEKYIFEKEQLMNKLSQKIKECSKDKIHENNIINLNNKVDNLFKEFQNIWSEKKALIEKIKSTKK